MGTFSIQAIIGGMLSLWPARLVQWIFGVEKTVMLCGIQREAKMAGRDSIVGKTAPEFTLPLLVNSNADDKKKKKKPQSTITATLSLASFRGKPLALIFGSYTCPVFRSHAAKFEEIHQIYKDRGIGFLFVYPLEAHPNDNDGWVVQSNEDAGISYPKPTTMEEKMALARLVRETFDYTMPMVVDTLDDKVDDAYGASPFRLYLLDKDGVVTYQGPVGPFGYEEEINVWKDLIEKAAK